MQFSEEEQRTIAASKFLWDLMRVQSTERMELWTEEMSCDVVLQSRKLAMYRTSRGWPPPPPFDYSLPKTRKELFGMLLGERR
jgi:hypothetical protein